MLRPIQLLSRQPAWLIPERSAKNMRDLAQLKAKLTDLVGDDDTTLKSRALLLNSIASRELSNGAYEEAEQAARQSLADAERSKSVHREHIATYKCMLSGILAERGKSEEAVLFESSAVQVFEDLYGADDSFVIYRKKDLADMKRGVLRKYIER